MNEGKLIQLNPALFWGKGLISFESKPIFSSDIQWIYDTNTSCLYSFDGSVLRDLIELQKLISFPKLYSEVVSKYNKNVIDELINHDIIITGNRKITYERYQEVEVWLQSNHFCNLACPGCSTGMDIQQDRDKKIPIDIFEKCLTKIVADSRLRGFRGMRIKIGGGEPTLNGVKFISQIAEVASKYSSSDLDIRVVLLTNGIAITDEIIGALSEHSIKMSVSTDPFRRLGKEKIQALPLVMKNIEKAKTKGVSVSGQLTISSLNYTMVGDIYESLSDLDVDLQISMFRPQTKEQFIYAKREHILSGMYDILRRAFNRIDNNKFIGNLTSFDYLHLSGVRDGVCGAGKSYVVLDVDGSVYSCHESIRTGKTGGNILKDDKNVFDMIDSAHEVPYRYRDSATIDSAPYKFILQGGYGCPWVVMKLHGTYNASAEYVTSIYEELAPVMLALSVRKSKKQEGGEVVNV